MMPGFWKNQLIKLAFLQWWIAEALLNQKGVKTVLCVNFSTFLDGKVY